MPAPEVWGPATWTLFHVLAEKINEFVYPRIAGQLFDVIRRICSALPCPECAQDATIFLSKVKIQELRSKNDFKNMIYMFHNYVNAKKRRPLFNYANLEIYKRYNIVSVFNRFISVYHTKGNMRLLAESFQRQLIIKNIREWFSRNIYCFVPNQQAAAGVTVSEEVIGVEAPISEATVPVVSEATVILEEEPTSNCCGYIKENVSNEVVQEVISEVIEPEVIIEAIEPEVISEAIEPEVISEAIEPEVISEAIEPEVIVPVEEVIAPEPEVISEAIEPEVIAPEPEVIAPVEEVIAPVEEVIAPVEEVSPEVSPESEVVQEETAPEEVKSEEETEVVESEATVGEASVSELTVTEASVSEVTVSEEPVKAKRGRKKKSV
jgi:hypothetical protein